ncbi:hypothetical protein A4G19_12725 [Pasteurellaceae bacterium Macca]|nr:hypothetical protein [Pasteurellaceae bacterium Macca]
MTAINKPSGAEAVWGATQDVMTMIGIKRTKLYTMMQEDKTFHSRFAFLAIIFVGIYLKFVNG